MKISTFQNAPKQSVFSDAWRIFLFRRICFAAKRNPPSVLANKRSSEQHYYNLFLWFSSIIPPKGKFKQIFRTTICFSFLSPLTNICFLASFHKNTRSCGTASGIFYDFDIDKGATHGVRKKQALSVFSTFWNLSSPCNLEKPGFAPHPVLWNIPKSESIPDKDSRDRFRFWKPFCTSSTE